MPTYKNGYIPDELLITFETGHNSTDGDWKHQLSPGTLAKWRALVELAKQHTGKTMTLHDGWSAYRPYRIQVLAKQLFGKGAAAPGFSSHGGFWENRQTLAMDVGNWEWVYGTREKFYADVRAVGLEPGLIRPDRGYPDEPWHIIDFSPWAPAPAGSITPVEEDDMLALKITNGKSTYCATLGRGVFRHLIASDDPERVKNIIRSADDWQTITIQELPVYLWTYGCDLNIWDVRNGDFAVLNPLDGTVKPGGMWSAENATRAAVRGIPAATGNYSEIAKAVNDEFSKRLAG